MRFIQLRSAPAQNAGPFPARTTTRTDAFFAKVSKELCSFFMSASSKAFRTSGRSSVTRATPPSISMFSMARTLHSEDAEARIFDRRIERGRNCEAQQAARVGGVDHAVVPQPCAGVVGMALALV